MTNEYIKATIVNNPKIACIQCGEPVGTFDHLKPMTIAGPWYCQSCGHGHEVWMAEGGPEVKSFNYRQVKVLTLLKLDKTNGRSVFLVQQSSSTVHADSPDEDAVSDKAQSNDRHYYEEHMCPGNVLNCEVMTYAGPDNIDTDPHGILRHIQTVLLPKDAVNGKFRVSTNYLFPDDPQAWFHVFPKMVHHLPAPVPESEQTVLTQSQIRTIDRLYGELNVILDALSAADEEAEVRLMSVDAEKKVVTVVVDSTANLSGLPQKYLISIADTRTSITYQMNSEKNPATDIAPESPSQSIFHVPV